MNLPRRTFLGALLALPAVAKLLAAAKPAEVVRVRGRYVIGDYYPLAPNGGMFTLTVGGKTSDAISWNATPQEIEDACEKFKGAYPATSHGK